MDEQREDVLSPTGESEKLRQALVGEIMTMDWVMEELGEDWRLKDDAPTLRQLRDELLSRLEELERDSA